MIGTFKEFCKFVNCFNPAIYKIWEDFHERPDPQEGDVYNYVDNLSQINELTFIKIIFDKVDFDPKFENGVAFNYIFHKEDGEQIIVHSINDVYDPSKLTFEDSKDLYAFWTKCFPVDI
jgi:hypothetical protein